MVKRLNSTDAGFAREFAALLSPEVSETQSVRATVCAILEKVRAKGDTALLEYTNRFDRLGCNDVTDLRVAKEQTEEAWEQTPEETKEALKLAAERIRSYHEKIMPEDVEYHDATGVQLGNRWVAIDSVGLYVPGGRASYPSSVLMNAIPAQVAGVKRLAMVVPAPEGSLNPLVLAAAYVAGIKEIYTIGGAQAVAALAYGTATVTPVDKIVGPGNAYVAEAKRQVFGDVGIDMVAGPSEILVISDARTNPAWVAADLLSQAEHDPSARSILITDSPNLAAAVTEAVERQLLELPRQEIARASWEKNGAVIVVEKLEEAVALANRIAPEHLELCVEEPEAFAEKITTAGAMFLGRYTPEAIGDYSAGPSHVLPTSGTARFSSGLSVYDFLRRVSIIGCSPEAFGRLASATAHLADVEGLNAHALSVRIRRESE